MFGRYRMNVSLTKSRREKGTEIRSDRCRNTLRRTINIEIRIISIVHCISLYSLHTDIYIKSYIFYLYSQIRLRLSFSSHVWQPLYSHSLTEKCIHAAKVKELRPSSTTTWLITLNHAKRLTNTVNRTHNRQQL